MSLEETLVFKEESRASEAPASRPVFKAIEESLDRNVYVDPMVKARLLEYFAVKKLNPSARAKTILCLLGPAGMGKTLIIKSLCGALSQELIQIPVGEVRNEEETILGRRRADMNATAGRIIHALQGLGPEETIVLLEDIDRTDLSGVGNTSADFFEILQYVQDFAVKNRYLSAPIDLSRVTFMATAKNLSTIPAGIRERMEIVTLPSYTEEEKLQVAKKYLIPDLAKLYDLQGRITFSEEALRMIIRKYTREAGVSELRLTLKTLFQTALKRMGKGAWKDQMKISIKSLARYLGPPRFAFQTNGQQDEVGFVRVLGKSEKGGCPIGLELLIMKGEGKLITTGNTDKMFHESALVALDYVRSRHEQFGIAEDFYRKCDIHLHLREGTIPKYGVSAGLAILTALVSGLTGRPVRRDVGMTGEISLHGKVLGVRDVRDKVLGAYQADLKTVFIPKENEGVLENLPKAMKRRIRIAPVDGVETVLRDAIVWDERDSLGKG